MVVSLPTMRSSLCFRLLFKNFSNIRDILFIGRRKRDRNVVKSSKVLSSIYSEPLLVYSGLNKDNVNAAFIRL